MESLITKTPTQTISKITSEGPIKTQAPAYLTDFMNFMAGIPTMYKDFLQDNSKSKEDHTSTTKPASMLENRKKINLQDTNVKQVVDSIHSLGIDDNDQDYLLTLGNRESGLNPSAAQGSFKGLYQFNRDSLKSVGISENDYKSDLNKQHLAALKYKNINLKILHNYTKYIGTTFKGTPITENGLAAAAHLLGAGTVMDWFDGTKHSERAKKGFVDGLGTNITEYFQLFA